MNLYPYILEDLKVLDHFVSDNTSNYHLTLCKCSYSSGLLRRPRFAEEYDNK